MPADGIECTHHFLGREGYVDYRRPPAPDGWGNIRRVADYVDDLGLIFG